VTQISIPNLSFAELNRKMGIGCLSLSEIFPVKTFFALRFDITLSFSERQTLTLENM